MRHYAIAMICKVDIGEEHILTSYPSSVVNGADTHKHIHTQRIQMKEADGPSHCG